METLRRNVRDFDFTLFAVLLLLGLYSCVALLASTYGKVSTDVPTHILVKQVVFEIVGFIALGFTASFDYRNLRKFRWWIYWTTIFLLVAVFVMPTRFGAHSWIPLGLASFQPSEFAKLAMIIAIASYMANIDEAEFPDYSVRNSLPIVGLFVLPFLLTLKEPALGQALVMFAVAVTMFAIFTKRSYFVLLIVALLAFVGGMALLALQFPDQSTAFIQNVLVKHHLLKGFQAQRILTWLNPKYSLLHYGYNVHQAQVAVASGGVFGEGLFSGIETRGNWIPNQWTDYIFTAIGEEFGFIGSSILVLLFLMLIYRLVRIAGYAQDTFGTYLIMGIVGMFAVQVFENIGADMYLSPSTGITLPFISYGGSSLVANYIAVGFAVSVSLRRRKLRFN